MDVRERDSSEHDHRNRGPCPPFCVRDKPLGEDPAQGAVSRKSVLMEGEAGLAAKKERPLNRGAPRNRIRKKGAEGVRGSLIQQSDPYVSIIC